jgi:hypothetical protein
MADSEGTETAQIEDAKKCLEEEKHEPMSEEQSTGISLFVRFLFRPNL